MDYARKRGRLVVLLGIDGSGKTALLKRLAERGFCTSSWKYLDSVDLLIPEETQENSAIQYIRGLPFGNYVNYLPPFSRAAFVLSLIFAEYEYLIKPHIDSGRTVITDTYYIRPLAKELVQGKSPKAVINILSQLPNPDLIIHLKLAPLIAFQRKGGAVSEHEVKHTQTSADFILFQESVEKTCEHLISGQNHVTIDASLSPDEIMAKALHVLEENDERLDSCGNL